jgi:mannan endo-1,4-beta-mannosidase
VTTHPVQRGRSRVHRRAFAVVLFVLAFLALRRAWKRRTHSKRRVVAPTRYGVRQPRRTRHSRRAAAILGIAIVVLTGSSLVVVVGLDEGDGLQSRMATTTTVPSASPAPRPSTSSAPTTATAAPTTSGPAAPVVDETTTTVEPRRSPGTTTPPPPAPPPPAPDPSIPLTVRNGRFVVDGIERQLVGINAAGAGSRLAFGSPCGGTDVDLDQMFAALPDRALVRVWFTQRMATHAGTIRDWSALDAVVDAAERAPTRPLLQVTLATGAGDCDGGQWRDRAWFEGGYLTAEPAMPNTYAGWVEEVVARYGPRPSVAIWEPVNEPDPSTCDPGYAGSGCYGHTTCAPGAASALARFLDDIGARIHAIDGGGLVADGGGGWCGWREASDKLTIGSSTHVDILTIHDYDAIGQAVPDWVSDTAVRASELNKPFVVGEVGIAAEGTTGLSLDARAAMLDEKVRQQLARGASAVLLWVYGYGEGYCGYCIGPSDPVLGLLRD